MSNELTVGMTTGAATTRLQEIEWEIQYHVERAAGHLIDIGRCLCEAKDEGLVPHGQWQEWVLTHTKLTVRGAQRIMQAAREIPKASTLTHLEFSKVQALLALPADEREDFAAQVGADDMTVRELQAAIKARNEATERARIAEAAAKEATKRLKDVQHDADYFKDMRDLANAQVSKMQRELMDKNGEMRIMREQARDAQSSMSPETLEKLNALQAEIDAKEAEIERQANLRAEAQQELLRLKAQAARGETPSTGSLFCVDNLAIAVRTFIGTVGVMPHKGAQLATISAGERQEYQQYVDMVSNWVDGARRALDTVAGEYIIHDGGEE